MTDPDRAPQPVEEAALAAGAQIRRVWELAFAQGIREGMEVAAKICESVAVTTQWNMTDTTQWNMTEKSSKDIAAITTADFLRDRIRELALEIDDPPPVAERNTPTEKE